MCLAGYPRRAYAAGTLRWTEHLKGLRFWSATRQPLARLIGEGHAPEFNDKFIVPVSDNERSRLPHAVEEAFQLLILFRQLKEFVCVGIDHNSTIQQEFLSDSLVFVYLIITVSGVSPTQIGSEEKTKSPQEDALLLYRNIICASLFFSRRLIITRFLLKLYQDGPASRHKRRMLLMSETFILDTCVLSEASKSRPNPAVIHFLETAPNLRLPTAVLMEFQLGITLVSSTDPVRAVRLGNWYQRMISAGLPILDTTKDVAEIWGVLAADPRLRNLAVGHAQAKRPRGGQDLHIAAFSLAHRLPIATMNIRDFELIDSCYPLPGLYSPTENRWHARISPLFPSLVKN